MKIQIDCCSMDDIRHYGLKNITRENNKDYVVLDSLEELFDLVKKSYSFNSEFGGLIVSLIGDEYKITVRDFYLE